MQILRRASDQNARFLPHPVDNGTDFFVLRRIKASSKANSPIQPQRCMIYIKKHYPRSRYETTFLSLWEWMYHRNIDISKPEHLSDLLKSHGYTNAEIGDILAASSSPEYKEALTANTQEALDRGAYGAPWFWVRNSEGREEPFFGSDRLVLILFLFTFSFSGECWVLMLMGVDLRICGST